MAATALLVRLLPVLIIMSMIGPLALNIIMPSMPGWMSAFDASRAEVQLTLSLFLGAQAISQLFIGALADRFGRKPVLLVSLGVFAVGSVVASFADSIGLLIAARVLQAAGSTAGLAIGRTIIRDLSPRETAASMIGYVTMAMVVAPLLAPTIGGLLDTAFGWRTIFWLCAALGAAALLLVLVQLPETRPADIVGQSGMDVLRRSMALVRDRRFVAYALGSGLVSAVFFTFIGAAPYLVVEVMQLPKTAYGPWFMVLSAGYMIGNFFSGRLSERLGVDRMIGYGVMVSLIGVALMLTLAMALPLSPAVLFLPCFVTSIGNGLFLPNAIAAAVSINPQAAGTASGVTGFMQMGIGALFSFIAGEVTGQSSIPIALIMVGLTLMAWWCVKTARAEAMITATPR